MVNKKRHTNGNQDRLDVERAVAEGMDAAPAPTTAERESKFRAGAMKLWSQIGNLLQESPLRVLGVVMSVSFVAGLMVGRLRRDPR